MNRYTDFERQETDHGTFVTAVPNRANEEPVRFDASITERDETSEDDIPVGNWEGIISSLAQRNLGNSMTIDDGQGVMSRADAVSALTEADEEYVRDEQSAHALLEYLAHEDILRLDEDGEVIILMDYDDIHEGGSIDMLNNWAATIDALVGRIDAAVDRVEENREALEEHFTKLTDSDQRVQEYQERADEIQQEMRHLLGDRHPDDLDEGEEKRFTTLRQRYHRYEMLAVSADEPVGDMDATESLKFMIEDLRSLKGELEARSSEFRVTAFKGTMGHEETEQLLHNVTQFIGELSETMAPQEEMEDQSNAEFYEEVLEPTSESQAVKDVATREEPTITQED